MADVEADLRAGLAEGARTYVVLLKRSWTTPDAAVSGRWAARKSETTRTA